MPRRRKDVDVAGGVTLRREKPVQRNAANARERTRMRVLARAFSRLKTTLPWVPADTKLSKLDTLRLAASYIAHLKGVLRDEAPLQAPRPLSWPFTSLHAKCNEDFVSPAMSSATNNNNNQHHINNNNSHHFNISGSHCQHNNANNNACFAPNVPAMLPSLRQPSGYSCGDDQLSCYEYY